MATPPRGDRSVHFLALLWAGLLYLYLVLSAISIVADHL